MIYNFIFYGVLSLVLLAKLGNNTKFFTICTLSFFYSAFRFNSGWDFFNYVELIESHNYVRIEPLSASILEFSYYTHIQSYFVITSLIFSFFLYKIYKNISDNYTISLIGFSSVFFLPIGFLLSLDRVRQFSAIIIFLYALTLKNRSLSIKIALSLISVLFHYTSLVFLPLIIFKKILIKPINILIQFFILFFSIFVIPVISVYISNYFGLYTEYYSDLTTDEGNKILILYLLFYLFFVRNFNLFLKSEDFVYYYNVFYIGLVMYSGLAIFGTHVTRIASLPLMLAPILFSYILSSYKQSYRMLFLFLMICLVVLLFYVAANDPLRDALNNYDLFFFHNYDDLSHYKIQNWYYK